MQLSGDWFSEKLPPVAVRELRPPAVMWVKFNTVEAMYGLKKPLQQMPFRLLGCWLVNFAMVLLLETPAVLVMVWLKKNEFTVWIQLVEHDA